MVLCRGFLHCSLLTDRSSRSKNEQVRTTTGKSRLRILRPTKGFEHQIVDGPGGLLLFEVPLHVNDELRPLVVRGGDNITALAESWCAQNDADVQKGLYMVVAEIQKRLLEFKHEVATANRTTEATGPGDASHPDQGLSSIGIDGVISTVFVILCAAVFVRLSMGSGKPGTRADGNPGSKQIKEPHNGRSQQSSSWKIRQQRAAYEREQFDASQNQPVIASQQLQKQKELDNRRRQNPAWVQNSRSSRQDGPGVKFRNINSALSRHTHVRSISITVQLFLNLSSV